MAGEPIYSWATICARVRELREKRGYSLESCAKALNLKTHGQYLRRETGETQFTMEELEVLRLFLGAPNRWPLISSEDAATLDIAERARTQEVTPPEVLQRWRAKNPHVDDAVLARMMRLANFERGNWDDSDIDLVRIIANKQPGEWPEGGVFPQPPPSAHGDEALDKALKKAIEVNKRAAEALIGKKKPPDPARASPLRQPGRQRHSGKS